MPSSRPGSSATRAPRAILGIVTDITARKRTERLLQSLNAATLAMEQALTPAEIFPSAVRVLSGIGFDSAVFMASTESPAGASHALPGKRHQRRSERPGPRKQLRPASLLRRRCGRGTGHGRPRGAVQHAGTRDTRPVFRRDAERGPTGESASAPQPSSAPRPSAAGVIFAPLVLEDTPFGLLVIAGPDLGPEDLQVFTAFAHQAAAAWRKTRLMRDLESSLEKLSRTQEQLLHSQKMEAVGRLAGGIAHDFNNLLTVISGYTSLLSDSLEGNSPALSDLGQIRNTIKRASALTSRLLTFSRKQILQPAVLDLNKVVANSVTLLRPLIGEDIELVVRLAPSALWVRADQGQIDQVLMNLAVNARDAMPGRGKNPPGDSGRRYGQRKDCAARGGFRAAEDGCRGGEVSGRPPAGPLGAAEGAGRRGRACRRTRRRTSSSPSSRRRTRARVRASAFRPCTGSSRSPPAGSRWTARRGAAARSRSRSRGCSLRASVRPPTERPRHFQSGQRHDPPRGGRG